jgi:ubiquinone/menaquinone biosynthesis C-methylase UbiE
MIKKEKYPKVDKKYLTKNIQKKQYFETIKKIIINDKKKSASIMDIGCASGDFLNLFKNKPQYSLHGFDYSSALIKLAKKNYPWLILVLKIFCPQKIKKNLIIVFVLVF